MYRIIKRLCIYTYRWVREKRRERKKERKKERGKEREGRVETFLKQIYKYIQIIFK